MISRSLSESFQIAGGSIVGSEHIRRKKNNQDAFCWETGENFIVGFVCDGCGSAEHSELGANLCARLLTTEIANSLRNSDRYEKPVASEVEDSYLSVVVNKAHYLALDKLQTIASAMAAPDPSSFRKTVHSHLLATAIGVIITPARTWIIGLGDGVYYVNEVRGLVAIPEGNAPPYLAYNLIKDHVTVDDNALYFKILLSMQTSSLRSLLIGTDGVEDLVAARDRNLPNKDKTVGPVSQFWTNDLYYRNPDAIRRKLFLMNTETAKPNWEARLMIKEPTLLPDDTTLIAIRAKAAI